MIAKAKNLLYFDKKLDEYTEEQIMVEYFGILFDSSEVMRNNFKIGLNKESDDKWADQLEKEDAKMETDGEESEFEDTFDEPEKEDEDSE